MEKLLKKLSEPSMAGLGGSKLDRRALEKGTAVAAGDRP